MGLLELIMFQLMPKGWQRISQHDVVRQAVPEWGSGNLEVLTANCRGFDWWHDKTVAASSSPRPGRQCTTSCTMNIGKFDERMCAPLMIDETKLESAIMSLLHDKPCDHVPPFFDK